MSFQPYFRGLYIEGLTVRLITANVAHSARQHFEMCDEVIKRNAKRSN